MKSFVWFFLLLTFSTLGCNYAKVKKASENEQNGNLQFKLPQEKLSELSFSLIYQKVIGPKCVACHGQSGNINLETYTEVFKNLNSIKKVVFVEQTMPKRGSLSDEEKSYLWSWIDMGGPEQSRNGNAVPDLEPITPTFESIDKNVFQTSCKECHNSTGTGKRILLDKKSLLDSPLELIIPGNSDESGLVIALERIDDKRMPPAKEGYSALNEKVKAAIRMWIDNGAKD